MMRALSDIRDMRNRMGGVGLAALALLAGGVLFYFQALQPLEARNELLQQRLAGAASGPGGGAMQPAAKLAALYQHLGTREQTNELLAKLHGIGAAAGVELRATSYRMQKTDGRIERYEMTLPVTGSYSQIRVFLGNALAGIPALSLDQVSFRKRQADDAQVQAEVRLTLHLVRSR